MKKSTPTEILTLQLRPRSLSQVLGQGSVVKALRQQVTERGARALLFHGPSGTGKTTLARITALSVQKVDGTWGELSDPDWEQYDRHCIHELNASDKRGIDDMRRIVEYAKYAPLPPSLRRVIILDEVHQATNDAANLLLKPTEETPEHLLWVLCTTEPRKIPDTLKRRCVSFELKPLDHKARVELLKRGATELQTKLPLRPIGEALEEANVGSPALILMALEKYAAGMEPQAAVVGADVSIDTLRLCRAMTRGDWPGVKSELTRLQPSEVRWVRAAVAGWLKSCLLKESNPQKCAAYGTCLAEITGFAPLEDGLLLPWIVGLLHKFSVKLR